MLSVTDGSANIIAAMRISNIMRFQCVAHSLHRCITFDILCSENVQRLNGIILKLKTVLKKLNSKPKKFVKSRIYLMTILNLYSMALNKFHIPFKIKKLHLLAALMDPCQKNLHILDLWLKKVLNETVPLDFDLVESYSTNVTKLS